ncbi:MAG: lysylphosphatidylglycerol synthase transmembrane domain-containing protein, partial [Tepidisphaeraceae bacterium]
VVLLVWLFRKYEVKDKLLAIRPADLVLAGAMILLACAVNTLRWQLLLRNVGIVRNWGGLFVLYLIGLFFTSFLPTGTGGDAVRIFDVARRSGKTAGAIVATLQERFFGMGTSMLIGLVATLFYWARLPENVRWWILLALAAGPAGVLVLLYPGPWVRAARDWLGISYQSKGIVGRVMRLLKPMLELPSLAPGRLLAVASVTAAGVVVSIGVYPVIGRSLNFPVAPGGWLLVIPLVWVIKMVPITLGGAGVGELAVVGLLSQIFQAPTGNATAIAFAFLALQYCVAMFGGLLLAIKMLTGTWVPVREEAIEAAEMPVKTIEEAEARAARAEATAP